MNENINILNEFKSTLGMADVSIQYIELHKRYFERNFLSTHSSHSDLDIESKSFNLNLSCLYAEDKINSSISNTYIVSVHAAFVYFLDQYTALPAFPYGKKHEDRVDILSWVISKLYKTQSDRPDDVNMWYEICNYYRLVRNDVVHIKDASSERKRTFSKIQRYISKNQLWHKFIKDLKAPNELDRISFDDQVLFSKAAVKLATHIFEHTKYDLVKHSQNYTSEISKIISKFKNNPKREYSILMTYFERWYSLKNHDYETDIKQVISNVKEIKPL